MVPLQDIFQHVDGIQHGVGAPFMGPPRLHSIPPKATPSPEPRRAFPGDGSAPTRTHPWRRWGQAHHLATQRLEGHHSWARVGALNTPEGSSWFGRGRLLRAY